MESICILILLKIMTADSFFLGLGKGIYGILWLMLSNSVAAAMA